mmetsp:Transcript_16789/g.36097  ORF Transcript_16789/g.36097 Transcript_16789/m.36097 type:complete len:474 (-) Transcript_16789:67-1488(-)
MSLAATDDLPEITRIHILPISLPCAAPHAQPLTIAAPTPPLPLSRTDATVEEQRSDDDVKDFCVVKTCVGEGGGEGGGTGTGTRTGTGTGGTRTGGTGTGEGRREETGDDRKTTVGFRLPPQSSVERLEKLSPLLRQRRDSGQAVGAGDIICDQDDQFVVIKSEPSSGRLGPSTDYFLEGNPVFFFQRIQFSAWGPQRMTSDDVFQKVLLPHFQEPDHKPFAPGSSEKVEFFYTDQMFEVGEVRFQVEATEPAGLGVLTADTEIFVTWDEVPEFDKVHIVPFQDTLPRAYNYDIFADYIKPFLQSHPHKKFAAADLFHYHGIEFKVVAVEPNVRARIGKETTIYFEGFLHPNLRNLLPPDLLTRVEQLPRGLQLLLLSQERTTRELEDMLTHRRGLFQETLEQIERFPWPPTDLRSAGQSTCMVCLTDFSQGDECRRLPCRHVFHSSCVDEWLRRCTDCPICKANVDRAIRNY